MKILILAAIAAVTIGIGANTVASAALLNPGSWPGQTSQDNARADVSG